MFLFGGVRVRVPVFVCESESVLLYIRRVRLFTLPFANFGSLFLVGCMGWERGSVWNWDGFCGPIGDPIVVAISGQGLYK